MKDPSSCLKAMSDKTRFSIIQLLLEYNFCAGALAKRFGISEAAVSQHLKILRENDLVVSKKCGYFNHYEVNREKLNELSFLLTELSKTERLPCDPSMEGCDVKKRCMCHADKHCENSDCIHDCKNCNNTRKEPVGPSEGII